MAIKKSPKSVYLSTSISEPSSYFDNTGLALSGSPSLPMIKRTTLELRIPYLDAEDLESGMEHSVSERFDQTSQPSTCSPVASSISSYNIIGTLGRGSYGNVLLGRLKTDAYGDMRAIKVLRKNSMDQHGLEEAHRELGTLRWIADRMRSSDECLPGVGFLQRMLESFHDDQFMFIVLEYHPIPLSDPKLASHFRLQRPVAPTGLSLSVSAPLFSSTPRPTSQVGTIEALRLLSGEMVLGLRFLHSNGMVHQDVKPANIMISSAGHVVIGDFGASATLPLKEDAAYGVIVLGAQDVVTFTPLYAAPELLHRNSDDLVVYDERVDWWSLGVMVYELATGSLPFVSGKQDAREQSRRSMGDSSLAFGELENLVVRILVDGKESWMIELENFIRSLLVHDPSGRLSGRFVQLHSFFDPISQIWHQIAALDHPPLPMPPPSSSLGSSVSLASRNDDMEFTMITLDTLDTQHSLPVSPPRTHGVDCPRILLGEDFTHYHPLSPLKHQNKALTSTLHAVNEHDLGQSQSFDGDTSSVAQPFPSSASIYEHLEPSVVHDSTDNHWWQGTALDNSESIASDMDISLTEASFERGANDVSAVALSHSTILRINFDLERPFEIDAKQSSRGIFPSRSFTYPRRTQPKVRLPAVQRNTFSSHERSERTRRVEHSRPRSMGSSFGSQDAAWTLEEKLTISVLDAMNCRDTGGSSLASARNSLNRSAKRPNKLKKQMRMNEGSRKPLRRLWQGIRQLWKA